MTAEYAALETRVSALELQMRHILPGKIDGVAYGLSLVREDTQAIRATQDRQAQQLERQGRQLDRQGQLLERHEQLLERQERQLEGQRQQLERHGEMLEGHGQLLAEILRRLPGQPD